MISIFRNIVMFVYKEKYKEFVWMSAKLTTNRKLSH